ncbi:unnamed protein product [Lupinus luteus]|uniref:Uncharacterized protein n=1 Tax=Lupinus luteus TaxID=3873 RepID=A0AAV1W9V4_LUPLU
MDTVLIEEDATPLMGDMTGPLNGSYYCVPSCHQCGERCDQEVFAASKERFSASAPDPYHSNLPSWLQIAEFGTTKGLNLKTKGDDLLLDSTESLPPDIMHPVPASPGKVAILRNS